MEPVTTIQVTKKSKKQWAALKIHPQESYEDMFNRIIKASYQEDANLLNEKDLADIEKSIKDIKKGKFMTNEQLKKKYGL